MDQNLPTNIYRFVNVRPPETITAEKLERNFLKHPVDRFIDASFWSNQILKGIAKRNGRTLYDILKAIPSQDKNYRKLIGDAVSKWEKDCKFLFNTIDSIYEKYSGLKDIVNWLRVNMKDQIIPDKISTLLTHFLTNLRILNETQGKSGKLENIQFDIADFQLRIWDNFICQIVKGNNCDNQLKGELTLLVKASYLIENYWLTKSDLPKIIPATIFNKTIVLPAFFQLPTPANDISSAVAENKGDRDRDRVRPKVKGKQVFIGGSLISLDDICTVQKTVGPCDKQESIQLPEGHGQVKMLGIGDLLVVKKQLIKYEAGEIAHIENVMASETRKRKLRNFEREEVRTETEKESSTETEKELTTSDKFDLEKETSSLIKSDSSLEAGLTVSASYGPVTATASLNSSTSNSKEESNKLASKSSQELTSRAASKISEKVKELRSKITIKEVEESNLHSFENDTEKNITGIYQFIDKIYRAQVYNYGKREFCELIIPRPAAQYIYFKANSNAEGDSLIKPIHPKDYSDSELSIPLSSYDKINENNYMKWASLYDAEVDAPSPETICLSSPFEFSIPTAPYGIIKPITMTIPKNYFCDSLVVKSAKLWPLAHLKVLINDILCDHEFPLTETIDPADVNLTGDVQISAMYVDGWDDEAPGKPAGWHYNACVCTGNIVLKCKASTEILKQWQIKTYDTILQAYNQKLIAYNEKLAQMEFGKTNYGNNPNLNRLIEAEEIKKSCIQLITGQNFDSFDALQYNRGSNHYPEFDNDEAKKEGEYIQFFEQAFEWTQMTYWFYPYFWGNKPNWTVIKQYEDNDPLFTKFLQAGAVRVMLPIRRNYENAIQYFLSTGIIWHGEGTPVIDNPLFLSIVDEIKEADGQTEHDPLKTLPWEIKVPTNFVMLKEDSKLPKFPVHKEFIIDGNMVDGVRMNTDYIDDYYPDLQGVKPDPAEGPGDDSEIYLWKE